MPAQRVLFLGIETISRELDSCVLLAHEMLDRDWAVVLGSRSQVWRASEALRSGVLVQTSGERGQRFPRMPEQYPDLRLVQYHQEGLAPRNDDELLSRYPESLDFAHRIFTFGRAQTAVLQSARTHLADRFAAVGSPRFDLLGPRHRVVWRRDGDLARRRPFILINTAFKAGNPSRLYRAGFEERFAQQNSSAWARDVLERRREVQRALMEEYLTLIRQITHEQADLGVVVRPHPSEDHETWRQRLGDVPNVAVEYRNSAVEWIERARVLVHTGCTTGLEARFLGRRALRFNPYADQVDEPDLPNLVSEPVDSAERIVDIALAVSENERVELTAGERSVVSPYLANAEGLSSVTMIANELEQLAGQDYRTDIFPRLRATLTMHPRALAADGRRVVRKMRRNVAGTKARRIGEQKFPGLSVTDVSQRLRGFEVIDDRHAASVRRLGRDVVGLVRRT